MDGPGAENDFKSHAFRQKVVGQIEEAMRKAGTAHTKSSTDMENHIFMKAKTRDDYLSLVARLILHFRDIHKKSQGPDPMNALQTLTGGPPGGAAGMGMAVRPQGAAMSAMAGLGQINQQILPGQPQPGASGMAPHGMQGVANPNQQTQLQMQMAQQQHHQQQFQQQQAALQQQQQQQQQFQTQQQQQFQAQQAAVQQQQLQQQHQMKMIQIQNNTQSQMIPSRLQQQQQQQLQQMVQMQQQLQQHQQAAQAQAQAMQQTQHQSQTQTIQQQMQQLAQKQQQAPQPQQAQMPPQSQAQNMVPQSLAGQMAGQQVSMNTINQQQQLKYQAIQLQLAQQQQAQQQVQHQVQQQVQHQTQLVAGPPGQMMSTTMVRGGMQIQPRLPRATAAPPMPSNTTPLGGQHMPQVSQSSLSMMSSPSPVQQTATPQSMPPPPQPQPSPQPPTSQPNSNVSSGPAPSPSGFLPSPSPQPSQSPATARTPQNFSVPSPGPLNTPVNPTSVMSPAGSSQTEEQLYLEKLKQLSKYIEPLRRMINKIDKNEERKKDLSKMKSLLDILTDPSKRCPLKTLQKCEIALEKLKNDMAVPTPPPPPMPSTKQQYLCQPLLDAVLTNIRSPVFNHSLYRTFAPAMTAIHGPPIVGPVIPSRKRKSDDDERQTIPNILQGEVARLNPKFMVNLDPSHCSNNGTVHLICKLDDKNLPSVPPLQLSIPADYPDQSPQWADDAQQYEANPFLQTVHRNMTSKLLQLPDKHSVTALLNTWAQSVSQACLSAA